ncbi:Sybindin-like family-domain-containing protein [Cokeromyces recurvatus]|uniref:Sybindin-like family-domain-containing protein n=1 Tax=Cokeromyces recurvatus TaxID=90255 RepID=UPI00221ECE24|nr:Sybindin-like family-domain-containing protein [Cokeromyces recurvatus]KAI7900002.1 Sybindin-like family-domain-containing protein [Cokeromyces recurvatus]
MTIYNLYIFDRHCQCIYFQKWTHNNKTSNNTNFSSSNSNANSQLGHSGHRLGGLTTSSSRFSMSSATSSLTDHNSTNNLTRNGEDNSQLQTSITQQSGLAAGSVISIEEEAKLVYGVILSLRNFVRKLSGSQDGFISYKTSTYRLHYYETPTGLKFVMNSDPNTENLRIVLKQIYIQLYVEFVVKNGLMRFTDTRWEVSQGFLQNAQSTTNTQDEITTNTTHTSSSTSPSPPGNISNELFRIAVDRFIRSLRSFE